MTAQTSSTNYEALRRECASVRQHLGIGATAIGRAYYEGTEFYAQAFFALSVGFERAAKLVLTLDAAASNGGTFLDTAALRTYGHHIDRLLGEVARIATERGFTEQVMPTTPIHQAIISILSGFASNLSRYYNLEVLQPGGQTRQDPIAAWYQQVTRPILAAHDTQRRQQRDEAKVAITAALPESVLFAVIATTETGEPIDSLDDLMRRTFEARAAQPWERMYVLQIARFVTYVLGEIGHVARRVVDAPYIEEFFYEFQLDDPCFRRLRIWPPRR